MQSNCAVFASIEAKNDFVWTKHFKCFIKDGKGRFNRLTKVTALFRHFKILLHTPFKQIL